MALAREAGIARTYLGLAQERGRGGAGSPLALNLAAQLQVFQSLTTEAAFQVYYTANQAAIDALLVAAGV